MSSVNLVTADSSSVQLSTTHTESSNEMDKDMFLQLLITQLQYQDPLEPMDNQEMLAQMAQFTALEQMKNVADITQKQYAQQMIGNYISYTYTDETTGYSESLVGKVDHIKSSGSSVLIGIGEHEVELSAISEIYDPSNIQSNTSAFELIGKTIQAVIQAEGSTPGIKEDTIIEGEVLRVHLKDTTPYVVIGSGDQKIEISLDDVQNIVEEPSLTDKYVTATTNDGGKEIEITGKVEYIVMQADKTYLCVNDEYVAFEDVTAVHSTKPSEGSESESYVY